MGRPFTFRGSQQNEILKDWFNLNHQAFFVKWYETITGIPFYYPDFAWKDEQPDTIDMEVSVCTWEYARGKKFQKNYNSRGHVVSAHIVPNS